MSMNYRNEARKHLKRSKEEFDTGDNERLKYTALELRMAMEALTYDRALAYKDEFPPDEYETWKPIRVMSVLLNIDPTTDRNRSIAFGVEEVPGVPAQKMTSMGSEIVLNMATLQNHYNALGSYLHVQSMKQVRAGKALDFGRMESRCEEIIAFIEKVLSSPVWNSTFGNFSTIACMECETTIRKRVGHEQSEVPAECYKCRASYTLVNKGNEVEWKPHYHKVRCGNSKCGQKFDVWHHQLKIGKYWICQDCKGRNTFELGISYEVEGSWDESS